MLEIFLILSKGFGVFEVHFLIKTFHIKKIRVASKVPFTSMVIQEIFFAFGVSTFLFVKSETQIVFGMSFSSHLCWCLVWILQEI